MDVDSRRIIVALDFSDQQSCLRLLEQLDPGQCRVKIGKELFTSCGPALVEKVISRGFEVFLDLKFHDIPNTVARAVAVAARMGVWMVNVHGSGGRSMLEAAAESIAGCDHQPLLIGVTVLTSLGAEDLVEIGLNSTPEEQVVRLAGLCKQSGLDGVVCSAVETQRLRKLFAEHFALVTPGIRPRGDGSDDQKRIVTPADAIRRGSDYLVIGRPITLAQSPGEKLNAIYAELQSIL